MDWKVICDKVGVAKFTASVKAGRAQDALEISVPVLPFGRQTKEFEGGEVGDDPNHGGGRRK